MKEKPVSTNYIHRGRIINLREDSVLLPDGRPAKREIVEHRGAVAVLGILPDGKLLFVKQYRRPLDQVLIEVPAGIPEKGEKGLDAARRELLEETGYLAANLKAVGRAASSPGYSNEIIQYFLACDLTLKEQDLDEDELVEPLVLSLSQAWDKIRSGEIFDGKTIALLALYERDDQFKAEKC